MDHCSPVLQIFIAEYTIRQRLSAIGFTQPLMELEPVDVEIMLMVDAEFAKMKVNEIEKIAQSIKQR